MFRGSVFRSFSSHTWPFPGCPSLFPGFSDQPHLVVSQICFCSPNLSSYSNHLLDNLLKFPQHLKPNQIWNRPTSPSWVPLPASSDLWLAQLSPHHPHQYPGTILALSSPSHICIQSTRQPQTSACIHFFPWPWTAVIHLLNSCHGLLTGLPHFKLSPLSLFSRGQQELTF